MMNRIANIGLFGDSILKGIQVNPENKRYYINNNIDFEMISQKYSIQIKNYSSFGCTVTKGSSLLKKRLENSVGYDAVIMDYGGNDCDYNWKAISEDPNANHVPNTPLEVFSETYSNIIEKLKTKGIVPILTTLPPLEPQRFFDWFCKDLNKTNVLKWLGEINNIYFHQETYSNAIEKIAKAAQVPLIDLRGAFLKFGEPKDLLCADGTHPNTDGQKIITRAFSEFAEKNLYV